MKTIPSCTATAAIAQDYGIDPDITEVTADSRQVKQGTLFVAIRGGQVDGRDFIGQAIAQGASAVLTDPEAAARFRTLPVPVLGDPNPRQRLAHIAACLYGPQPRIVAAVTGTNGKTSTASFARQIWASRGHRAASLGTLGVEGPAGLHAGNMTTPDAVTLHKTLAALAQDQITHAVMEASSHGLEQHRLDGVRVTAAAFTNLTQDHLDYHGTMQSYLAAKRRLFTEVLTTGGTAVLNADIPEYAELATVSRAHGHRVLDYGMTARAISLRDRQPHPQGQILDLDVLGRRRTLLLPLMGGFQASNALAALGLALATDIGVEAGLDALEHLAGVRGRMEHVLTLAKGGAVFVDYAHTPDGLEKILSALKPHAGRLLVVFGAGGDRDRTKRPLMGAVAAHWADHVIVTDDNPRSERPSAIRAEILQTCPDAVEIGDRAEAIGEGMAALGPGDVLVVAGKGHEQGQTIAGITHPFDDAAVVREIAARLDSLEAPPPKAGHSS